MPGAFSFMPALAPTNDQGNRIYYDYSSLGLQGINPMNPHTAQLLGLSQHNSQQHNSQQQQQQQQNSQHNSLGLAANGSGNGGNNNNQHNMSSRHHSLLNQSDSINTGPYGNQFNTRDQLLQRNAALHLQQPFVSVLRIDLLFLLFFFFNRFF
jgi:hypothetical protein